MSMKNTNCDKMVTEPKSRSTALHSMELNTHLALVFHRERKIEDDS